MLTTRPSSCFGIWANESSIWTLWCVFPPLGYGCPIFALLSTYDSSTAFIFCGKTESSWVIICVLVKCSSCFRLNIKYSIMVFLPGHCLLSTLCHPFASDSTPPPPLCHRHVSLMDGLSEHPELLKPLANSQFSHSTGNFCFSSHCPDVLCPLWCPETCQWIQCGAWWPD